MFIVFIVKGDWWLERFYIGVWVSNNTQATNHQPNEISVTERL